MAIKKIPETLDQIEKETDDFWGRHNLTTRTITLISTLLLVIITVTNMFLTIPNFDIVFKTLADMVLYITIIIILGVNGATKVLTIFKGSPKTN